MTTKTARKNRLHTLSTTDLLAQYRLSISSYVGRYSNYGPRQKRIDYIVDLLDGRADDGDAEAVAWFEER